MRCKDYALFRRAKVQACIISNGRERNVVEFGSGEVLPAIDVHPLENEITSHILNPVNRIVKDR